MAKKYKKVCFAFDTEQYAQAIKVLDKISRIHQLLNNGNSSPISTTPFTRQSDRIRVPFPVSISLLQEDI
jgi:hypothetical protein